MVNQSFSVYWMSIVVEKDCKDHHPIDLLDLIVQQSMVSNVFSEKDLLHSIPLNVFLS